MTNKNNWQITRDYLYGLFYEFTFSGSETEKKRTYEQLLKDAICAGENSGLFCLHFKDSPDSDPDSTDRLTRVENLVNWDKVMTEFPKIDSCFNSKGKPHFFTKKMWFYNIEGQLIYKEFTWEILSDFLDEIEYDDTRGGVGPFICFSILLTLTKDFVNQTYTITGCYLSLLLTSTIWFPYRFWRDEVYYDNLELARLNCMQLDILLESMGDLMTRYKGSCRIEDDNPGYKGAFITPTGIDWAEFDRQSKFYNYQRGW